MRVLLSAFLASCLVAVPAAVKAQAGDEADETFVVTAHREPVPLREVGSSVSVITAEELQAQGVLYVEQALRRLAGVQASTSGGAGGQVAVRLRGEESYRTLVLIDGIKVSDGTLPQAAVNFGNLTVTGIERIEVLRGPQALLYGADAIGGVINIVTRRGDANAASFALEAGSFETYTGRGYLGRAGEHFDVALSGDYTRTDGISAKVGDPTLADDDGYRNVTLHGVFGIALSEQMRLEVIGRYMDAYTQVDGFSFDPDRELMTEEIAARAVLSGDDPLGFGAHHQLAYDFYRSNRDDLDGGQPYVDFFNMPADRYDNTRHGLEYLVSFNAAPGQGVLVGAEAEVENVTTNSIDRTRTTAAAFAEWQSEWSDRFFTTLGARYDMPEDFGDHISLRATTAYLVPLTMAGETKFRASVGTGFRAPSAFEQNRNEIFALSELHEETGVGFDLGVDQPLMGRRATFSLTYFDQRIKDEIRFDNIGFTGYFQAEGTSHARGVETALEADLGTGFSFAASYTYTDATVNSPDPEDGLPRVRRPRHMVSVDVDYTGMADRLRVNANLSGSADAEDGFREFRSDLPDYVVAGISVSYEVANGVVLTARMTNLFDAQYQEVAGFATPGRAVFAGVRVRF